MRLFFAANLILQVVSRVVGALLGVKNNPTSLLPPMVITSAWINYFTRSDRVRRTFTTR